MMSELKTIPLQCHPATSICSSPKRLRERIESKQKSVIKRGQKDVLLTNQVQVVLDHIGLVGFSRQCAIAHLDTEVMMRVIMPHRFDIFPLEKIFDEIATINVSIEDPCSVNQKPSIKVGARRF